MDAATRTGLKALKSVFKKVALKAIDQDVEIIVKQKQIR